MALEASVLDPARIRALVNKEYGIEVQRAERLPLGTANCYRLYTSNQSYFLKEFQSSMQETALLREADLTRRLAERGIRTAQFIRTKSGGPFIVEQGHLICLQEYIEGTAYGYDDFPKELLMEMGALLGRLHTAMAGCTLPSDKIEFTEASLAQTEAKLARLLSVLEAHRTDKNYQKIKQDLHEKSRILQQNRQWMEICRHAACAPSHGDFQGCQLICGDGHIRAVIDFSAACTLPLVWEVMRSYVQTSSFCRRAAKIDADELLQYVAAYLQQAPLSQADLAAMPYVYLWQLSKSAYGYEEYLLSESEDRDGLLAFAFWRTRICQELVRQAPVLSRKLSALAAARD